MQFIGSFFGLDLFMCLQLVGSLVGDWLVWDGFGGMVFGLCSVLVFRRLVQVYFYDKYRVLGEYIEGYKGCSGLGLEFIYLFSLYYMRKL